MRQSLGSVFVKMSSNFMFINVFNNLGILIDKYDKDTWKDITLVIKDLKLKYGNYIFLE